MAICRNQGISPCLTEVEGGKQTAFMSAVGVRRMFWQAFKLPV